MRWSFLMIAAAAFVGGCTSNGPLFQPTQHTPSEAVVYIYRSSGSYQGSAIGLDIMCDGTKIGTLKGGGYLSKVISPGPHRISCKTETEAIVPFSAEADQSYYITAEVELGFWEGRPKLVMVPADTGKLAILSTRLSQ